jgi:hypothetical protein
VYWKCPLDALLPNFALSPPGDRKQSFLPPAKLLGGGSRFFCPEEKNFNQGLPVFQWAGVLSPMPGPHPVLA